MVYKKYVKRGGKTFGPYYYESYRDADGKVKTRYLENYKPRGFSRFSKVSKRHVVGVGKYVLIFAFVALLVFFAYSVIYQERVITGHVVDLPIDVNGYYNISNCTDLNKTRQDLNANYQLVSDINCSDTINWNGGAGFEPIGNFTNYFWGNFYGRNHTIINLYINRTNQNYVGLFGAVAGNISNVWLVNVSIFGNSYTGGLVGLSEFHVMPNPIPVPSPPPHGAGSPYIDDVHVIGIVNGNSSSDGVGGLVGYQTIGGGTILGSSSTALVVGSDEVGGLVGFSGGTISNSYSTGRVIGYYNYIGGLVGYANRATISNSYSTGNVSGDMAIGGLVGYMTDAIAAISNSYSTGNVSGSSEVGGLIGFLIDSTVSNSFWDNQTSGQSTSAGGTEVGKMTAQMKNITTFSGASWDIGVGSIYLNKGYPYLSWQVNSSSPIWMIAPSPPCGESMLGNGTAAAPCQITTCAQLQAIDYNLSANYVLKNNIDCLGFDYNNDGRGFKPIGIGSSAIGACNFNGIYNPFVGVLNGSGFNVTSLNIYRPDQVCVGLFSSLGNGSLSYLSGTSLAKITNFGLIDVNITGAGRVGGLVGEASQATISNSFVIGNISSIYNGTAYSSAGYSDGYMTGGVIGGLAGAFDGGIIINSYSSGKVNGSGNFSGSGDVGGLVGQLEAFCNSSYSSANVFGDTSCGGLVGSFHGSSYFYHISNSYARGNVSCRGVGSSSFAFSGGLIGDTSSDSRIINSYSTGNVFGNGSGVGGLVGGSEWSGYKSNITNCFSVSNVTGKSNPEKIGMLAGNNFGNITNSYYWNYSGGSFNCSGTGNSYPSCTAVNDKTLFYNQTNSPLTSWDFTNIWMEVPNDYPILRMGNVNVGCVSDNSCVVANICSGSTCTDNCGQVVVGTKDCTVVPPDSCFPAGTKISMADGRKKNIEDVLIGDYVLSYDTENKKVVNAEVLDLESPVRDNMCELAFEDNSKLKLTDEHPVYTSLGWKSINPENSLKENPNLLVGKLVVGDNVLFGDEVYRAVIGLNCWNEGIQTYNLKKISEFSNYFAGNVLVHNKDGGPVGPDCTKVTDYVWGKWGACDANNKMIRQRVSKSTPACSKPESKACGCISSLTCGPWGGSCEGGTRVRFCEESCTGETVLSRDYCNKNLIDNLEGIAIDYPSEYPDAPCGEWGICEVSYNFVDLLSGIENLEGTQRSLCFDERSGTNFYKAQSCSIKSNVFARKLLWCGKNYVEIVDIATNKTVSLINNDRNSKTPSLDIVLIDDKPKYCEYCYNEVMDEDEEEMDCGGSCKPCGIGESYWMTWLQRLMWSLRF